MITAWGIIKQEMTKGKRPGSTGYFKEVLRAALLFARIVSMLKNHEREVEKFNSDPEATYALLNRRIFESL